MNYNSHTNVCCDICADLYSDSVFRSAPEFLNFEVQVKSLEELLYQPSAFIKVGKLLGCQVYRIGQEHELTILHFVIVSDETQIIGIILAILIDC